MKKVEELAETLKVNGIKALPYHAGMDSATRSSNQDQFLMEEGIPAGRLAAAGFGQFQPLDDGFDEIANRRNRRIELKLTER